MSEHEELEKIHAAQRTLEELRSETDSPAIAMALRHAVYYCHLAGGFLGDDGLGPEIDSDAATLDVGP